MYIYCIHIYYIKVYTYILYKSQKICCFEEKIKVKSFEIEVSEKSYLFTVNGIASIYQLLL